MSWLPRTPATDAMSLTRSAWTSPATSVRASAAIALSVFMSLERQERQVEEPREQARRVRIRERAFAAVRDHRVRDLERGDRVVRVDVDRPHDALDAHVLLALVDRDPLLAAHQQVAVRQALRDGDRDVAFEPVALRAGAFAVELGVVVDRSAEDLRTVRSHRPASDDRTRQVDVGRFAGRGCGALGSVRALVETDGQRIADTARDGVLEQSDIVSGLVDGAVRLRGSRHGLGPGCRVVRLARLRNATRQRHQGARGDHTNDIHVLHHSWLVTYSSIWSVVAI